MMYQDDFYQKQTFRNNWQNIFHSTHMKISYPSWFSKHPIFMFNSFNILDCEFLYSVAPAMQVLKCTVEEK